MNEPMIASGGKDKNILLWNVDHYFNSQGRITEEDKESVLPQSRDESEKSYYIESQKQQTQSVSRLQKNLQSYLTDSKPSNKPKL